MEIRDFHKSLDTLMGQIATLPEGQRKPLEGLVSEAFAGHKALRAAAAEIEDALVDIRLNMAYLTFDLEATRRECDQLRTRLENHDNDFE